MAALPKSEAQLLIAVSPEIVAPLLCFGCSHRALLHTPTRGGAFQFHQDPSPVREAAPGIPAPSHSTTRTSLKLVMLLRLWPLRGLDWARGSGCQSHVDVSEGIQEHCVWNTTLVLGHPSWMVEDATFCIAGYDEQAFEVE